MRRYSVLLDQQRETRRQWCCPWTRFRSRTLTELQSMLGSVLMRGRRGDSRHCNGGSSQWCYCWCCSMVGVRRCASDRSRVLPQQPCWTRRQWQPRSSLGNQRLDNHTKPRICTSSSVSVIHIAYSRGWAGVVCKPIGDHPFLYASVGRRLSKNLGSH